MTRKPISLFLTVTSLSLILLAGTFRPAQAYQRWSSCSNCHGSFTSTYTSQKGGKWPSSLHTVHRSSTRMGAACNLCHTSNGDNPYMKSSGGGNIGCIGCHGASVGGAVHGWGLIKHHVNAGTTVCNDCHAGEYDTTAPESTVPPYYGTADTNANFPCNDDANTSEDWSGDGVGLDNDGDLLYDTADPDCGAVNTCGNGVLDDGETCDPPGAPCPTDCDDANACTADTLTGAVVNCDVACTNTAITSCQSGDGCCPNGCTAGNDNDCSATCGNGVLDNGETCDPINTCPTDCDDANACTTDTLTGAAATCDAACTNTAITSCQSGDGCCPNGCTSANDNDCTASCGNGIKEGNETCDPPGAPCPTSCDDGNACTTDTLSGAVVNCDVRCTSTTITACASGDGCCPSACNSSNDGDCSATCGNGVVDNDETCDPVSTCPTACDDGNVCTSDTLTGSAANCNAACLHSTITLCQAGDGCCPAGCTEAVDSDCVNAPADSGGCSCGTLSSPALAGLGLFGLGLVLAALRRRNPSGK